MKWVFIIGGAWLAAGALSQVLDAHAGRGWAPQSVLGGPINLIWPGTV